MRALRHAIQPTRLVAVGFLAAIVVGAILLSLPIASVADGSVAWIEALFTSVSSVTITGLAVVDTATTWTVFGQVVILLLVQLGGLGIMTFGTFIGLIVVRRMSLTQRLASSTENRSLGLADAKTVILGAMATSLIIEAICWAILAADFSIAHGYAPGEAVWLGLFHAVMAFNNAGFALWSSSLTPFVDDPVVNIAVAVTVILGGLGFPVIFQLRKHLLVPRLWSMNTRLVLFMSAMLLVGGWGYITVLEWNNPATLGALEPGSRVLAGFFQSAQTRTGGFNTVDIGAMNDETLFGMTALMFIGGGPAGTSGGIKVTTLGVLFFIMVAEIRGHPVVNVFGKRLSRSVHREAITVLLLSAAFVGVASVVLMLTTGRPLIAVLFEATSAFATTGLSTGITPTLDPGSQLLLCVLMVVGRLGPISFASALALRNRRIMYQYPKERPIIG